jgi:diguanylate cyclase (GGDEF)-like protein
MLSKEIHSQARDGFQRSWRLTLALCFVVFVIMIATGVMIERSMSSLAESRELTSHALLVDGDLKDLMNQMLDAETGQRGFLLSGQASHLQPYYEALAQLDKSRLALTDALQREPATVDQLNILNRAISMKLQELDHTIHMKIDNQSDEAVGLAQNNIGKEKMDAVRNAMHVLAAGENQRTKQLSAEYVREIQENYWIIATSLVLNLLLFAALVQRMRYTAMQGQIARKAMGEHNDELSLFLKTIAERNAQVNGLSELSRFLQSCIGMEEAVQLLKQHLPALMRADSGVLYFLADERDQLRHAFAWGSAPYVDYVEPADCWAVRLGQPFRQPAQTGAATCKHLRSEHPRKRDDIHCLPLVAHGELMGLLVLDAGIASDEKTNLENEGYRRITLEQVGLSIGNLKLRESLRQQSIRDALTGLYNRRFLEESAQREVQRAIRMQAEGTSAGLSFLMIDIDHFKRFNDEFGHSVGDQVLCEISEILQRQTRSSDVAARYGGEEFTIVLVNTSLELAIKRAEQVRVDVENLVLKNAEKDLGKITISIGLAQFPIHGNTVTSLLAAADHALYQAKRAGRNQVVMATEATLGLLAESVK